MKKNLIYSNRLVLAVMLIIATQYECFSQRETNYSAHKNLEIHQIIIQKNDSRVDDDFIFFKNLETPQEIDRLISDLRLNGNVDVYARLDPNCSGRCRVIKIDESKAISLLEKEKSIQQNIIYPNPVVNNIFSLEGSHFSTGQITIFSLNGEVLQTFDINNTNEYRLNPKVSEGNYSIRIQKGDKVLSNVLMVK